MTIQIALSPESEELIRQQVEAGVYQDASDLIEDALKVLYHAERFAALKAAVEAGIAEADEGEDLPYTPELLEEIRQEARRLADAGHIPNPDVCP
jgi:antitoxin ParD1/3/4